MIYFYGLLLATIQRYLPELTCITTLNFFTIFLMKPNHRWQLTCFMADTLRMSWEILVETSLKSTNRQGNFQFRVFVLNPILKRLAYRSSFHVSGTPGRHQWLQSCGAFGGVPGSRWLDGWPSFLNSVKYVMFRNWTFWFAISICLANSDISMLCSGSGSSLA